jgi:hypothetical protein
MKYNKIIIWSAIAVAVLAGAIFLLIYFRPGAAPQTNKNNVSTAAASTTFAGRTATIQDLLAQKFNWPVDKLQAEIAQEHENFMKGTVTLYEKTGDTVKIDGQDVEMPKINLQGLFLAVKTSGGWQIVWAGAGNYDCQTTAKYQFPSDMVKDCQNTPNQ